MCFACGINRALLLVSLTVVRFRLLVCHTVSLQIPSGDGLGRSHRAHLGPAQKGELHLNLQNSTLVALFAVLAGL